jgi:hypothetical protein
MTPGTFTLPNGMTIRQRFAAMPVVARSAFAPRHKPRRPIAITIYEKAIGPQPPVTLAMAVEGLLKIQVPDVMAAPGPQEEIGCAPRSTAQGRADAASIVKVVRSSFGITTATMVRDRGRRSARARHLAMWLMFHHTRLYLTEITRFIGCNDHSTVIYGVRKINAILATDTAEAAEIRIIIGQCRRELGLPDDGG